MENPDIAMMDPKNRNRCAGIVMAIAMILRIISGNKA
jgi:hypothetical protein